MRRFVVVGQKARASPDFSLEDLPATSGRLDILLRCLRASLLVSHGLRADTIVYLVLMGGPRAPRALRFEGSAARFLRPDERSLATLVRKTLAHEGEERAFATVRPGIAIAGSGIDAVLADLAPGAPYILEEGATDLRVAALETRDPIFFVGDHFGFDDASRAKIAALGAMPIGIGPVSVHADDAIAIVCNELDRRA
jgi:tRNA (pseudouridine54-N1)-methyltransferase